MELLPGKSVFLVTLEIKGVSVKYAWKRGCFTEIEKNGP